MIHGRAPVSRDDAGAADHADLRDDDVRLRERRGGADVQRGEVVEVPLLALREPDGASPVEQTIAALEGGRDRRWCCRAGRRRRRPRCSALLSSGDEVSAARRSTAARCTCSRDLLPKFGIRPRFVSLEELARADRRSLPTRRSWCGSSRRSTRRCAAWTSRRSRPPAARAASSRSIDNTFASPINQQPHRARRRPGDAQRDEVPERPQRRDRRRAGRAGAADRADREGAEAARRRCSIRTPPTRSAAG